MQTYSFTATAFGTFGTAVISITNATAQHSQPENYQVHKSEFVHTWGAKQEPIVWGSILKEFQWNELKAKVQSWQSLPVDWDGDGGIPPSVATVNQSRVLLSTLQQSDAPLPKLGVAGDGEIELKWEKGDGFASISFLDDGHLVAYVRGPRETNLILLDKPVSEINWEELTTAIRSFA